MVARLVLKEQEAEACWRLSRFGDYGLQIVGNAKVSTAEGAE